MPIFFVVYKDDKHYEQSVIIVAAFILDMVKQIEHLACYGMPFYHYSSWVIPRFQPDDQNNISTYGLKHGFEIKTFTIPKSSSFYEFYYDHFSSIICTGTINAVNIRSDN